MPCLGAVLALFLLAACAAGDPGPALSISLTPASATLEAGGTTESSVELSRRGDYAEEVSVAVEALPDGLSASMSPATLSRGVQRATLSVHASPLAPPGTTTLTVRATGTGAAVASATFALTVVASGPSMAIALAPPAATFEAGGGALSTLLLASRGGYVGKVSLTVEGLPPGVSASLDPNTLGGGLRSAKLTVFSARTARVGTTTFAVRATASGVADATATFTLTLTSTGFLLAPLEPLAMVAGQRAATTVTVTRLDGFAGEVVLSFGGAPPGVTGAFAPPALLAANDTSTLTIAAETNTAPGTYYLSVFARTAGHQMQAAQLTLDVTPIEEPDYRLLAAPAIVLAGKTATTLVNVMRRNGFSDAVTLVLYGLPSWNLSFSPNPVPGGAVTSTLAVAVPAGAEPGTYYLDLEGIESTIGARGTQFSFTVASSSTPGLAFWASPATLSVPAGDTATAALVVNRTGGFSGDVSLSVDGPFPGTIHPPGLLAGEGRALLRIPIAPSAPPGDYFYTLTAAGSGLASRIAPFWLSVASARQPGFTLSVAPGVVTLTPGQPSAAMITVTRTGGFTGDVALALTDLPPGVAGAFSPAAVRGGETTATLALTSGVGATPGLHALTVNGSGAGNWMQATWLDVEAR